LVRRRHNGRYSAQEFLFVEVIAEQLMCEEQEKLAVLHLGRREVTKNIVVGVQCDVLEQFRARFNVEKNRRLNLDYSTIGLLIASHVSTSRFIVDGEIAVAVQADVQACDQDALHLVTKTKQLVRHDLTDPLGVEPGDDTMELGPSLPSVPTVVAGPFPDKR